MPLCMSHCPPLSQEVGSGLLYLSDFSARDRRWDNRKQESLQVAKMYRQLGFNRYAERMLQCSPILGFKRQPDPNTGESRLKLHSAHFCRVRLCPVCQWRRSLMWVGRFIKAMPSIRAVHPKARFLFLTLTVRNCPVGELRDTIGHMNRSWQRVTQRKAFPGIGYAKSLEVTRSVVGEAHPHFHALLMVPGSYFQGRYYLKKAAWVDLWRSCLQADYRPSVHVQAVKPKEDPAGSSSKDRSKDPVIQAIVETLKYSVKPADLVYDLEWLQQVTDQLHKVRSVSVGGEFRKFISEEDPEDLIGEGEGTNIKAIADISFGFHERHGKYMQMKS